jgi:hypothetical protein
LQPGGTLMMSVPAWRRRFGPSDTKVGHYRRYDRSDVLGLLERTGFVDVRVLIYGFPVGYALQPIWNALAKRSEASASVAERTSASGRWIQPPLWLGWAPQLLSLPFRRMQRLLVNTNLGTGFVAIARRPDGDTSANRIASRPSNWCGALSNDSNIHLNPMVRGHKATRRSCTT